MSDLRGNPEKAAALGGILETIAATARSGNYPDGAVAVAFSGGLDSRFLIHMARQNNIAVQALHVQGPHIPSRENAYALEWAASLNVPLTVMECDPLTMPELVRNPEDRCYHCKKELFTALRKAAKGLPLCDGTNVSDMREYRPGLKAVAELGILSPLAEAGFTKGDIHSVAAMTGMGDPDQAAQPCLLTRFGYGETLTHAKLLAVDAAEEAARTVFANHGLLNAPFRIRFESVHTPALHTSLASIPSALAKDLADALAHAGLPNVPIRHMKTLSGYFDTVRTGFAK